MITVVRFTRNPMDEDIVTAVGTAMNVVRPGSFEGIRARGDGFAFQLLDDAAWSEHRASIARFVELATGPLSQAREAGIDVCVDVMIGQEDLHEKAYEAIGLTKDLVYALARFDMAFEVTMIGWHEDDMVRGGIRTERRVGGADEQREPGGRV